MFRLGESKRWDKVAEEEEGEELECIFFELTGDIKQLKVHSPDKCTTKNTLQTSLRYKVFLKSLTVVISQLRNLFRKIFCKEEKVRSFVLVG